MISAQPNIYCLNPHCEQPVNSIGNRICSSCQTPLTYPYLWATGAVAAQILPGTKVADRYEVITPQIWLDTTPEILPEIPSKLPTAVTPYLKLFPERLHIPQAYGFVRHSAADEHDILLLENIPVDQTGTLYPTITVAWEQATAVRQVYWLWQILQLWTPLLELGVAESLLIPDNLRTQGWCVKLIELSHNQPQLSLSDLGQTWQSLVAVAKPAVSQKLEQIVQQMLQIDVDLAAINTQLNQLLLVSASELPLTITMSGSSDIGPVLKQNEDTCYPSSWDESDEAAKLHLSIVCDGIGGHEGGEVASQLAVQSLKLQIRALLTEIAQQTELVSPDMLQKQLKASLRIVNNVIWSRNDQQKRQGKERMATTMVMALQISQKVMTNGGWLANNAHELYIASIGDSRAYWMTPKYCQLLTIDDDIAAREVIGARSLYRQAIHKPNAHALTQALGTKEAESLNFSIKRFILEEDGVLLICSDGLSDQNLVEQSWQNYAIPLLTGEMTIVDAVNDWIKLAYEKKSQDNISLVLALYQTSPTSLVPVISSSLAIIPEEPEAGELVLVPEEPEAGELVLVPEEPEAGELAIASSETAISSLDPPEEELAESSLALLDLVEASEPNLTTPQSNRHQLMVFGGLLVLLLCGTSLGLGAWWQFYPQSFSRICAQLPRKIPYLCPNIGKWPNSLLPQPYGHNRRE